MCLFGSAICVFTGDDIQVYLDESHQHRAIRERHGLRVNDDVGLDRNQTPVEFTPVRDLMSEDGWDFRFDADKPDWWTDAMTVKAKYAIFRFCMRSFKGNTLTLDGNIYLSSLTTLPSDAKLKAGGDIDLRSLTTLPSDAKLKAGGSIYLSSLTTLPSDAKLKAGGNIFLKHGVVAG